MKEKFLEDLANAANALSIKHGATFGDALQAITLLRLGLLQSIAKDSPEAARLSVEASHKLETAIMAPLTHAKLTFFRGGRNEC